MPANPAANLPTAHVLEGCTTAETLQLNSTKLYAPEVTLFVNNTIKFLENIKQRFKKTFSWNKYRS